MVEDVYPLSPLQEGMFYHWLSSPGSTLYFEQASYRIQTQLNIAILEKSYQALVDRHAVLRTFFTQDFGDVLLQVVQKDIKACFIYKDVSEEKDFSVEAYRVADRAQGFDLSSGSQMRLMVLDLGGDIYEFIWSHHHILMDGWCIGILIREFFEIYYSLLDGKSPALKKVYPYASYIAWLSNINKEASLRYWRNYLQGYDSVSLIPKATTGIKEEYTLRTKNLELKGALRRSIRSLCAELGITENTFIQTAWGILLSKYNNTGDVVFGAVVSGRPAEIEGIEQMIGVFVNTIPVRIQIKEGITIQELLKEVQERSIEATGYHYVQLAQVQSESELGRDLFDHIVVFENYPVEEKVKQDMQDRQSLRLLSYHGYDQTNYDLSVVIIPAETIEFRLNYNANKYDETAITLLGSHLLQIITQLATQPTAAIDEVEYLSSEEKGLLQAFNNTALEYPRNKTIIQLFEEQAAKTPDHAAVAYNGNALTYQQLNEQTNRLGAYLREQYSIVPNDLVGIQLERSEWLIIAILGVLKSGAAYVPVDPAYPQERIDYMVADSRCKALINEKELKKFRANEEKYERTNPTVVAGPNDLLYVIYTSGSTGQPKGATVKQHSFVNLIGCYRRLLELDHTGHVLLMAPISFDLAQKNVFTTLLTGATLYLPVQLYADYAALANIIAAEKITVVNCAPSAFYPLLNTAINDNHSKLRSIKKVILGGEPIVAKEFFPWLASGFYNAEVINTYGPTECTDTVSYYKVNNNEWTTIKSIPIGVPVDNANLFILDRNHKMVPVGMPGEIFVAGDCVGKGYINKPDQTLEKFIKNPFQEGTTMYRTGDMGQWLPDGNVDFLGRCDHQVKINGYRIELGEIEHALQTHPDIENVVVVARPNQEGVKELVAYLISREDLNALSIRSYLYDRLPAHMLPTHFVQLAEFPLTPSGKIDKKRLPDPAQMDIDTGITYVAPRNNKEKQLAAVYEEVLKKQPVGIKDDFFVLGGDSIRSIQIVSRLKQRGYSVSIDDVMRHPVIEDLAAHVTPVSRPIDQGIVEGVVGLTPGQQRFFESDATDRHYYNQSVLLYSKQPVAVEALRTALVKLIQHHDALRMVFRQTATGWQQENRGIKQPVEPEVLDYKDEQTFIFNCERIQSGMDLQAGPLFKTILFRGEGTDRLLLVAHQLVIDDISWQILVEDLSTLYDQYTTGKPLQLPLKTDSFQYWQQKLLSYAKSERLQQEAAYWSGVEQEQTPSLPVDHGEGNNLVKDTATASFVLDEATTLKLQTQCYTAYHTDANDILLTALSLAVSELLSINKVAINIKRDGREYANEGIDISRTVGWCTALYPVVFDMQYKTDTIRQLVEVKESLHRVPGKGIGYGILRYLGGQKYKQEPDITFNYLGDVGSGIQDSQLFRYSNEYYGQNISGNRKRNALLDVAGTVTGGKLTITISYSKEQYEAITIDRLLTVYREQLQQLIEILAAEQATCLTPTDLTYSHLRVEQVLALDKQYSIEDIYPLGPLQAGLYYHWLSGRKPTAYIIQMSYQVKSVLGLEIIARSYELLVQRHAVLRTFFTHDYGEVPLQIVQKQPTIRFQYRDAAEEPGFSIEACRAADQAKSFDLNSGSQMRLEVVGLGNDTYAFIWSHHHILMDGWCVGILIKEFFEIYHSLLAGQLPELKKVYPYSNYIAWLSSINREASLRYWRNYLQGYNSVSLIPATTTGTKEGYAFRTKSYELKGAVRKSIRSLCADLGITENTFLQTAWGILLSKYNNTRDVVFGAVVSGRPAEIEGIEQMIGLFINTVPVRIQIREGITVEALLKEVQQRSIEATNHHYVQLAEVQAESELGRELFNHIMVYENYPVEEMVKSGIKPPDDESRLSILSAKAISQVDYDFSILVLPVQSLLIQLNYNSNLFDDGDIDRLGNHLMNIIKWAVEKPDDRVDTMACLNSEETNRLVNDFNDTALDYPRHKTVTALFEEQVERTPDHTAVLYEGNSLTYKTLNEYANQLGAYLSEQYGVGANDLVGIQLERSEWLVVALLGVLKSGAGYVPIDPAYPKQRIDYMLADSQCKVVIDETELAKFKQQASLYDSANLAAVNTAEDLAYVIYTSGSTGLPKGVMIGHRNVNSFIHWCKREFAASAYDIVYAVSSVCFDLSVFELFFPLCTGKKIRILNNALSITEHLSTDQNILLNTVPGVVGALLQQGVSFSNVTVLNMAGEPVNAQHVSALDNGQRELWNVYGPTEITVYCTAYRLKKNSPVLIGRPVNNTFIYILDKDQCLSPVGVPGELYISGEGVARGYLNRPELTAERFVTNPFIEGTTMYRTGDMGRWLPDGNIEFLGRKDDQVKIRGYRIELGEIENVLQQHTDIDAAVVTAKHGELVAYVKSATTLDAVAIRNYISTRLPAYMLPAHFVQLAEFPLTPSGKVDKKQLPDPQQQAMQSGLYYEAATNEIQQQLITVFEEVLKKQPIGIKDDFFVLGGDSIKSIQIVSRLKQRGYSVTIGDVMRHPVIEQLAVQVKSISRQTDQVAVEGITGLTPIQQRFFERAVDKHHYNQSVLLYSEQPIAAEALRAALVKLVQHHDALRMVFHQTPEGWLQENRSFEQQGQLEVLEYIDEQTFILHCEKIQSGFDLQTGPLFKAALFKGKEVDRLLLVAHHLVIDGVSWRILFEDLSALYNQYTAGEPLQLPLKTDSFHYWQQKLLSYATGDRLQQEAAYWSALEQEQVPLLPVDHAEGSNLVKDTAATSFALDEATTHTLQTQCYTAYHTEINDILLTALSLAINEVFGVNKVLVQLEGHGREDIGEEVDITRTIGWFTTMYPVVFNMQNKTDTVRQLIDVKETLHRVPAKGIGYGILRYLAGNNYKSKPPIIFNYLGDFGTGVGGDQQKQLFGYSGEYHGRDSSPDQERDALLDVSGIITGGKLNLTIRYSNKQYQPATIEQLLAVYREQLKALIGLLSGRVDNHPMVDVSYNQLFYLAEWAYNDVVMQLERDYAELNTAALQTAVQQLIARHDNLRTVFIEKEGIIKQQVLPVETWHTLVPQPVTVLTNVDMNLAAETERKKKFDRAQPPLISIITGRLENGDHRVIFTLHHAISDGYSGGILLDELQQLYLACLNNAQAQLPPVRNQYLDYSEWQKRFVASAIGETHRSYWLKKLKGFNPQLNQPDEKDRSIVRLRTYIQGTQFEELEQFSKANGLTHNMIIMGAVSLLLHKLYDRNDLTLATFVSGRDSEYYENIDISHTIGFFVNTLFIRLFINKEDSITDHLQNVKNSFLDDLKHKAWPFAKLAQELPGMQLSRELLLSFFYYNYHNYKHLKELVYQVSDNKPPTEKLFETAAAGLEVFEYKNALLLEFSLRRNQASSHAPHEVVAAFNAIVAQVIHSSNTIKHGTTI